MKIKSKSLISVFLAGTLVLGGVNIAAAMPNQNITSDAQQFIQQQQRNTCKAPTVQFNGQQLNFDVSPQIENGTALVPLRAILEALGAQIQWDQSSKTVTAVKNGENIKLTINQKKAYKNGTPVNLDVPGKIVNGRVLVPLRFISESFGANVTWDQSTQTIKIYDSENSNNLSISDINSALNNYFEDAGEDYFDDDGITTTISLNGNEENITYTVKLYFDNVDDYDNLTDISKTKLKSLMSAIKSKIISETDGSDYENADITGKVVDGDNSSYYVEYNGSSYIFTWD